MSRRARAMLAPALILLTLLVMVSVAAAEALVVVRVQGPRGTPDGTVTLTPRAGGGGYSCETERRTCRINGVRGGMYVVRFRPNRGQPPRARTVMIPPEGTVRLFVSTGQGR